MEVSQLEPGKKKNKKKTLKLYVFVISSCHSSTFEELKNLKLFSSERATGWLLLRASAPKSSGRRRDSLAFAVLQVEMRIEVDEDPLVGTGRGYHPCASLRGGIRQGISWRGEVAGRRDPDVTSAFICKRGANRSVYSLLTVHKVPS